jgi:crotonobetainyl-CoA:carnitine CoA-transferase CaiB-like acyl-CoA transferase
MNCIGFGGLVYPGEVDQAPAVMRVVDLSSSLPGAYCCRLLKEAGVIVTTVMPPGGSADRRFYPELADWYLEDVSIEEIDLKRNQKRAFELLDSADAYIISFRPGSELADAFAPVMVLDRCPGIVGCWIRGFDSASQYASLGAHDILFQAMAGLIPPAEEPPRAPVVDLAVGLLAATRITQGLLARREGGPGQAIEVSMEEIAMTWSAVGRHLYTRLFPSYGGFRTSDGKWIALGFEHEDPQWRALCQRLDLLDIEGLSASERQLRSRELRRTLSERISTLTSHEFDSRLNGSQVAWGYFSGLLQ